MNARPTPRPDVLEMAPYAPGKGSPASAPRKIHKLSSNEGALGPSEKVIQAYRSAAANLNYYPDPAHVGLRRAIAERYGLNADRIVCGNGSDEILSILGHAYLGPGDEAVMSAHGFVMYRIIAKLNGARLVEAPETDLTANVDALLAAVTERTRIVFLANPNNPTGTYLPVGEVNRLQAGLPPNVLLVIDAAYAEFVRANDYEAGIELVATCDNVVMTRTFSKVHALAAVRLGWAYCPPHVAEIVNRVRGPFNVTAPAMAAGAVAVHDVAHVDRAVAHNEEWRPRLAAGLTDLGFEVKEGVANFVLIRRAGGSGPSAADLAAGLAERGIFVRTVSEYGLAEWLRVTVGTAEANQAVLAATAEILRAP
jgi:histidinol-phosphate aminotransferase